MNAVAVAMAKLAGLLKTLRSWLANPRALYFDPRNTVEYFESYNALVQILRAELPELFGDAAQRQPALSGTSDFEGRGYIVRGQVEQLVRDIEYIFEVRANSELEAPASAPRRVFISHGRAPDWREVQAFIEKDIELPTLELAQQPNRGRTILQKLAEEAENCSYAVIVMTGDDVAADGEVRARENVMHEIGYFQGKYELARVCLLHEDGVNVPSNIHGLVYIPFPKGLVSAAFGALARELKAAMA